jgi:hypothetical protein
MERAEKRELTEQVVAGAEASGEQLENGASRSNVLVKANSNGDLSAKLTGLELDGSESKEELAAGKGEAEYDEEEKENKLVAVVRAEEDSAENEEIIDGFSFLAYETDLELKVTFFF